MYTPWFCWAAHQSAIDCCTSSRALRSSWPRFASAMFFATYETMLRRLRPVPQGGGCHPIGGSCHGGISKMSCIGRFFSIVTLKSGLRSASVSRDGGFASSARTRSIESIPSASRDPDSPAGGAACCACTAAAVSSANVSPRIVRTCGSPSQAGAERDAGAGVRLRVAVLLDRGVHFLARGGFGARPLHLRDRTQRSAADVLADEVLDQDRQELALIERGERLHERVVHRVEPEALHLLHLDAAGGHRPLRKSQRGDQLLDSLFLENLHAKCCALVRNANRKRRRLLKLLLDLVDRHRKVQLAVPLSLFRRAGVLRRGRRGLLATGRRGDEDRRK